MSEHPIEPQPSLLELSDSRMIECGVRGYRALTKDGPGQLFGHSCNIVGDSLYVFGGAGITDSDWSTDEEKRSTVWALHTQTLEWTARRIDICRRYNHATAVVGSKIYIHGGVLWTRNHDDSNAFEDGLYAFDVQRWLLAPLCFSVPEGPSARALHSLTSVNKKLYLFGGCEPKPNDPSFLECNDRLYVFDVYEKKWNMIDAAGAKPTARCAHSMIAVEEKLILFGGMDLKEWESSAFNDVHVFDIASATWSEPSVGGSIPPGLRSHAANFVSGRMIICGGEGYPISSTFSCMYSLDLNTFQWSACRDCVAEAVNGWHLSACYVNRNRIFVYGGILLNYEEKSIRDHRREAIRNCVRSFVVFHGIDKSLYDIKTGLHILTFSAQEAKLSGSMNSLMLDSEFSDMTLVAGGEKFPVHRAILANRSSYFQVMLSSKMRGSNEKEIVIPTWSAEAVKAMLEYIYTHTISATQLTVVVEVLELADVCVVDGLRQICVEFLKDRVTLDNVGTLLDVAVKHEVEDLKNVCTQCVFKFPHEVIESDWFKNLKADSVSRALLEFALV